LPFCAWPLITAGAADKNSDNTTKTNILFFSFIFSSRPINETNRILVHTLCTDQKFVNAKPFLYNYFIDDGNHDQQPKQEAPMKNKGWIMLFSLVLMIAAGQCKKDDSASGPLADLTVVFVGASITDNWDFDHYFTSYNFEKVIHYDWDKTQVWDEVQNLHPDIVLVKECGAYFYSGGGTPLGEFESNMENMVNRIRNLGAIPVLCTTLPVDVGYGDCTQAQLDDLRAFNDWVRNYCSGQGIVLMDYYEQIADSQGQLPTACHDGDGLHPNSAGYDILSPIVIPTLESAL
jgi:hypothetical protein